MKFGVNEILIHYLEQVFIITKMRLFLSVHPSIGKLAGKIFIRTLNYIYHIENILKLSEEIIITEFQFEIIYDVIMMVLLEK